MIEVKYKCRCMPKEAAVQVMERSPEADLLAWMHVVQASIALDHGARSPRCMATEMEYAKLPMDEDAPGIGMKPQLSS